MINRLALMHRYLTPDEWAEARNAFVRQLNRDARDLMRSFGGRR